MTAPHRAMRVVTDDVAALEQAARAQATADLLSPSEPPTIDVDALEAELARAAMRARAHVPSSRELDEWSRRGRIRSEARRELEQARRHRRRLRLVTVGVVTVAAAPFAASLLTNTPL